MVMCAGHRGGKDTCYGDSGGPILIYLTVGTPVLIGLTSSLDPGWATKDKHADIVLRGLDQGKAGSK